MVERPTGTVTFLFTDIEGSTRLWEEHPAEMRVALERHDEIVRSAVESNDGYVFSTAGDAFAVRSHLPVTPQNTTEEMIPLTRTRFRV